MSRRERAMPGSLALRALLMLAAGLAAGFGSKWLDLNSEFLGKLFSRIMIWFVLCTAIAVRSRRPAQAALNVFAFCVGMLCAYYLAAFWWQAEWGRAYLYGWLAFSLCSPVLAYLTWFAGERGGMTLLLRLGIPLISLAAETVLFGFRAYNLLLAGLLALFLFSGRQEGRGTG